MVSIYYEDGGNEFDNASAGFSFELGFVYAVSAALDCQP